LRKCGKIRKAAHDDLSYEDESNEVRTASSPVREEEKSKADQRCNLAAESHCNYDRASVFSRWGLTGIVI